LPHAYVRIQLGHTAYDSQFLAAFASSGAVYQTKDEFEHIPFLAHRWLLFVAFFRGLSCGAAEKPYGILGIIAIIDYELWNTAKVWRKGKEGRPASFGEFEVNSNHVRHIILASVVALLSFLSVAAHANTIIYYVDDDAPLGGDGRSWETAYRYLQDALSSRSHAAGAVLEEEVEIRVAQGGYLPDRVSQHPEARAEPSMSFRLLNRTTLKGGYAGLGGPDPNAWDPEVFITVLSGDLAGNDVDVDNPSDLLHEPTRFDNSNTIIRISDVNESAALIGFTITGAHILAQGRGYIGGAMSNRSASPAISNCTFTGNASLLRGAAILNAENCSPNITDCVFSDNHAGNGGGVYGGEMTLTKCKFINNSAFGGGALSGCSGLISNCMFINNSARGGGAISSFNGTIIETTFSENSAETNGGALAGNTVLISSCTFKGNTARNGGAISIFGGAISGSVFFENSAKENGGALYINCDTNLALTNCTLTKNSALNGNAVACSFVSGGNSMSEMTVMNSILWNGGQEIWTNSDPSRIQVFYSNVLGGWPGIGNIDEGPLFSNSDEGDFYLQSQAGRWDPSSGVWIIDDVTSPCIDVGDPNSPIMYEPFPNDGRINMGAYGGTTEASRSYFSEPVCETIIAGDINGDCRVDSIDLRILMDHWLEGAD
jgi:predicted outer membrane repeat protein